MRLQIGRVARAEKLFAIISVGAPRLLVVLKDAAGLFTEARSGRMVPSEEIDAMGSNDLVLILETGESLAQSPAPSSAAPEALEGAISGNEIA
jgi:hypothetical protein